MHGIENAERTGDCLRENGRDRCAGNACTENQHKQQIQYDVQHRADNQKQKRRLAVAKGVQHGGGIVIDNLAGAAADIDPQIERSLRKNIPRRLHQPQERLCTESACDAENDRAQHSVVKRAGK